MNKIFALSCQLLFFVRNILRLGSILATCRITEHMNLVVADTVLLKDENFGRSCIAMKALPLVNSIPICGNEIYFLFGSHCSPVGF